MTGRRVGHRVEPTKQVASDLLSGQITRSAGGEVLLPSNSRPRRRRGPVVVDISERDRAVLTAVDQHGVLTAGQLERVLFAGRHASTVATRRRCQAVLRRLVDAELLDRMDRRVGGHRAGSSGFIYRLTTRGHRVLGDSIRGGRWEPSERHLLHLLATAEVSVQLAAAARQGDAASLSVTHEPQTWRRFVGPHQSVETLKPDLLVEIQTRAWELRWFVEVDRATEHLPTVVKKCVQYQRYWQSGQEDHPVFPRVLWSVPDERRATAIEGAIEGTRSLEADLFRVATSDQTLAVLLGKPSNEDT